MNFASSGAIFQLSSKHRDSRAILNLYIIFLSIQLISIVSIISLIYISDFTEMVFNSKDIWLISYIAIVEFINFIFTFLLSYGDAKGLTLIFQRVKTYELLGRGSLILALYALDILTLYSFLSVTLITAVVSNGTLLREVKILDNFSIIDRRYRVIIGKILDYSLPLAVVELISIFYNMADIFLIESMLGSEVFARYIYSYKLILATLIFIQPMFNIFWQYVASNFQKNLQQIQTIFYRLLITIFALSTSLIFFLLNFSEDIILLFTDDRYLESAKYLSALSMIALPLAIEKLSVVVLYSTGSTRKYRNIVVTGSLLSILSSLIIFILFQLNRIDIEMLIWVVIVKITIYIYLLNIYILKGAIDILKMDYFEILKSLLIISIAIIIPNLAILWLGWGLAIFASINLSILYYIHHFMVKSTIFTPLSQV